MATFESEVTFRVTPDTGKTEAQLKSQLTKIVKSVEKSVSVNVAAKINEAQLRSAVQQAAAKAKAKVDVALNVDTKNLNFSQFKTAGKKAGDQFSSSFNTSLKTVESGATRTSQAVANTFSKGAGFGALTKSSAEFAENMEKAALQAAAIQGLTSGGAGLLSAGGAGLAASAAGAAALGGTLADDSDELKRLEKSFVDVFGNGGEILARMEGRTRDLGAEASAALKKITDLGVGVIPNQSVGVLSNTLGKLSKAFNSLGSAGTAAFNKIANSSQVLDRVMIGANNSLGKLSGGFKSLVTAGAAAFGALVIAGTKFAGNIEQQNKALEAIVKTQLGAGLTSEQARAQIQKFADVSQFSFDQTFESVVKLSKGLKITIPEALSLLNIIESAGFTAGASAEQIESFDRALVQIAAKGRFQTEEALQLAETGLVTLDDLYRELARNGESTIQVQKRISDGQVTSAEAINATFRVLNRNSAGVDIASGKYQTLNGTLSAVADVFKNALGNAVLKAIEDAGGLDHILDQLKTTLTTAIPVFVDLTTKLIRLTDVMLTLAEPAAKVLDTLLKIADHMPGALGLLGSFGEGIKNLFGGGDGGMGGGDIDPEPLKQMKDVVKEVASTDFSGFKNTLDDIINNSQAVTAAKQQESKAGEQVNKLLGEQAKLLKDVASEQREVAAAQDAVLRANNALRDLEERRVDILRDLADLQRPATTDELAAAQDAVTKATIALNRAEREQLATETKLTNNQKQGLDITGLSLEQIKTRLNAVRLILSQQKQANTTTATNKKTQAEIDEDRLLAGIAVRDAQRELNTALEDQDKLQNRVVDNAIAIREATEDLADLQIDIRDAERERAAAEEEARRLASGDTTRARGLKDLQEQIRDALNNQVTASQAVRDAEAKRAESLALSAGSEEKINKLLFDRLGVVGQLDAESVASAKSALVAVLPGLLSQSTLADRTTGAPLAGPHIIDDALIKTVSDQLLASPGSDLRAILKTILRKLGLAIPGLQAGGLVKGVPGSFGTLIRAGENFKSELMLPITQPNRASDLLAQYAPKISLEGARKAGKSSKSSIASREEARKEREALADAIVSKMVAAGVGGGGNVNDVDINLQASTNNEVLIARAVEREIRKRLGNW